MGLEIKKLILKGEVQFSKVLRTCNEVVKDEEGRPSAVQIIGEVRFIIFESFFVKEGDKLILILTDFACGPFFDNRLKICVFLIVAVDIRN